MIHRLCCGPVEQGGGGGGGGGEGGYWSRCRGGEGDEGQVL